MAAPVESAALQFSSARLSARKCLPPIVRRSDASSVVKMGADRAIDYRTEDFVEWYEAKLAVPMSSWT